MVDKYQVIVGNVGQAYSGNDEQEALTEYEGWVEASKIGNGSRAAGEPVTLMFLGEIWKEYSVIPDTNEDLIFTLDDWKKEVLDNMTRLGYVAWVEIKREEIRNGL